MFLWNWFVGVLNSLGLYGKSGKLLFLGLQNAGKTSLMHMLTHDRFATTMPTGYATSEEMTLGGVRFTTFDLGGHREARRVWRDYFPAVDGIVFLIDATARHHFLESKAELDGLLMDEQIANVPMLILANKIDDPRAASENEIRHVFQLQGLTTGKTQTSSRTQIRGRPIELFMCSVFKRQGYGEGIRWLAQYI